MINLLWSYKIQLSCLVVAALNSIYDYFYFIYFIMNYWIKILLKWTTHFCSQNFEWPLKIPMKSDFIILWILMAFNYSKLSACVCVCDMREQLKMCYWFSKALIKKGWTSDIKLKLLNVLVVVVVISMRWSFRHFIAVFLMLCTPCVIKQMSYTFFSFN